VCTRRARNFTQTHFFPGNCPDICPERASGVTSPGEPLSPAPMVVIWHARAFLRLAGERGHRLTNGDIYRECSTVGGIAIEILKGDLSDND
jgi:hypothetical protein